MKNDHETIKNFLWHFSLSYAVVFDNPLLFSRLATNCSPPQSFAMQDYSPLRQRTVILHSKGLQSSTAEDWSPKRMLLNYNNGISVK